MPWKLHFCGQNHLIFGKNTLWWAITAKSYLTSTHALAGSKRSQNNSCSSCCQVLLFCPWQWADPFIHSFLFWTSEKRARQGRGRTLFQSWPLLKFFSGQKVCRTNFCQQTQELDTVVSINFWGKALLIWFYVVFVVNLYFIAYLGAVFRNSPQQRY